MLQRQVTFEKVQRYISRNFSAYTICIFITCGDFTGASFLSLWLAHLFKVEVLHAGHTGKEFQSFIFIININWSQMAFTRASRSIHLKLLLSSKMTPFLSQYAPDADGAWTHLLLRSIIIAVLILIVVAAFLYTKQRMKWR